MTWILIAAGAVLAAYAALVGWLIHTGRRTDARALAGFVPDCLALGRGLWCDDRVPRHSKLLLGAMLAYLLMPIDLVPDFIPVAGQLDDLLVIVLVLRRVVRSIGADVIRAHWPGPPRSLDLLLRLAGT